MKVIFLDIDGVLNHGHSLSLHAISRPAASKLRGVIRKTGAKVVLSSSWRKIESAVHAFRKKSQLQEIDKTPAFWHGVRGYEIKRWLMDHPEVKHYVIIDDESDMLEEQRPHFIKCDPSVGLTTADCAKAVAILEGMNETPFEGELHGRKILTEKMNAS